MADDRAQIRCEFARQARVVGLAWLALIVLMLLSLGSAYLRLGVFNTVAGPAIAAIKTGIVVWIFMRLHVAGPLLRMAALVGLGVFAIQVTLTGIDYETRASAPAAVQPPQQPFAEPPAAQGSR